MPGPMLTMSEVADMLAIKGTHGNRSRRATEFLQKLERSYGVTLLIKVGGTVRVAKWYCPRATLESLLNPKDDTFNILELRKTVMDLRLRVEELERHIATGCADI